MGVFLTPHSSVQLLRWVYIVSVTAAAVSAAAATMPQASQATLLCTSLTKPHVHHKPVNLHQA